MKKPIFSLLIALLALAACSKEKNLAPAAEKPAAALGPLAKQIGGGAPHLILLTMNLKGTNAGWCDGPSTNCVTINLEDGVTVKPHLKTILDNAANSGSSKRVSGAFYGTEMAKLFGTEVTELLQSGNYYLGKSYDNGKVVTYMAGKIYPVTLNNFEFAIQGRYQPKELKFGAEGLIPKP